MERYQIEQLLERFQGVTFASLDTVTVPVLKGGKANPFQNRIEKRCNGLRVMLFTNTKSSGYENKVKRHLEQAGLDPDSFKSGPLPWGERVPNSPFITNGGKLYLQCVFLSQFKVEPEYYATDEINISPICFWEPGMRIEAKEINGLNERTGSEHQGLERSKQVIVRTYAIESIVALRAMGSELK